MWLLLKRRKRNTVCSVSIYNHCYKYCSNRICVMLRSCKLADCLGLAITRWLYNLYSISQLISSLFKCQHNFCHECINKIFILLPAIGSFFYFAICKENFFWFHSRNFDFCFYLYSSGWNSTSKLNLANLMQVVENWNRDWVIAAGIYVKPCPNHFEMFNIHSLVQFINNVLLVISLDSSSFTQSVWHFWSVISFSGNTGTCQQRSFLAELWLSRNLMIRQKYYLICMMYYIFWLWHILTSVHIVSYLDFYMSFDIYVLIIICLRINLHFCKNY